MTRNPPSGKQRRAVVWAAIGLVLLAVFVLLRRAHFDWTSFFAQLRDVSWPHILFGIALIYATYWLRAMRWAEFCRALKPLSARALLGPQFIGFTAVALFGRLADLARPYLVARRVDLSVSSQIAVYTVERMFDLGAAAVVFSSALALTPAGLEHRDRFVRVGLGSLAATLLLAGFAVAVRLKGEAIAGALERATHRLSPGLARQLAARTLEFRDGLRAVSSVREFGIAAAISLSMWAMIGGAYWQTAQAFVHTPELGTLNFSRTMLLMAASLGGSLVQLPGLGWFTQIGATAAAMHAFYGAPLEAATACGALLLVVTNLSIVPAGLLFAKLEGVNLRAVGEQNQTEPTAPASH